MKKKKAKGPIRDVPAYQKLVEDIGKIFEESRQSGFDFNGKMHFLKCFDCGCFELPVDAQKPAPLKTWICREDGTPAGEGREFIILDIKRREYLLKNGRWRSRRTYLYICGVCGAQQKVCHVDEYGFAGQEGPADSGERP